MGDLKTVLRFGWQYMRPYWTRLVAGIVIGALCGLTAGAFLWVTQTIAERLSPEKVSSLHCPACGQQVESVPCPKCGTAMAPVKHTKEKTRTRFSEAIHSRLAPLKKHVDAVTDDWLPRMGAEFNWRRITGGLLLLPLLALVRGTGDYLSNYCMGWVSERVIADLRFDVLSKLTSLSLDYFNSATTGDMLTRINTDTLNLHRALRQGCADLSIEISSSLGVLFVLFATDPVLTSFVLVFVPLIGLPLFVLGKKARRAGRAGRKANVGQTSMLVEALTGIRVVKAFNLENQQLERFRELAKRVVHAGMKGVQAKELTNPIIYVVAATAIGSLLMYLFWSGRTLADLVGFVAGVGFLFTSIKKISAVHILFEQAGAGVERIVELLEEKPSVVESTNPKPLQQFEKGIRFEDVSFSYGKANDLVVRGLNLDLPRGFKLGVAGESGSGKSTVVNLLFRFYDVTSGTVKIDGVDVRDLSFADLRRHMALVSQDVFVFRMTVAENIAAGKIDATREEIEAAARAANAHDFIMALPQGYDTLIGERGMTLSGGQRQRLAIARAFVRNAPILVLDEATASLDSQSEAEVQAAIDRLEENRTVISVAHRLSTLAAMDQIIVLSKGRVVEQGTFAELLKAKGLFATMAARQGIFAAV